MEDDPFNDQWYNSELHQIDSDHEQILSELDSNFTLSNKLEDSDDENLSLIDQVYQKKQLEDITNDELNDDDLEELNDLEEIHDRNWIPDDIILTTNDTLPIIYVNSPKEKPEIYPVKLATITLNGELPINFNLKVIALYIELDEYVIGVKCEQVCQRGWFKKKTVKKKKKKKEDQDKEKKKGRKDKADFYNQCTINVKPYGKDTTQLINMKLFPNGKVGFTGVKNLADAEISLKIVLNKIQNLHGTIVYLPKQIEFGNSKNFKKKVKQRVPILSYISDNCQFPSNWNEFTESIETRGKNPYPDGLVLPDNISFNLCILDIILTYFYFEILESKTEPTAKQIKEINEIFHLPIFAQLIEKIKASYLDNKVEYDKEEISLISNYFFSTQKNIPLLKQMIEEYLVKEDDNTKKVVIFFYLQKVTCHTLEEATGLLKQFEYTSEIISDINDDITNRVTNKLDLNDNEYLLLYTFLNKVVRKESNKHKVENIEDNQNEIRNLVEVIDFKKRFTLDLPAWSTKEGFSFENGYNINDYYSPEIIHISNINTTFNTNFILIRKRLHQLLISKYQQTNCSLEPNYGGVKLTYRTVVDCQQHDDPFDKDIVIEFNGCKCKDVSILIFPNITLITGARSFQQILNAYEFIKNVMIQEFSKILKIDKNSPDPLDKYPNIISSNKYVHLKKKFIQDSPKNNFILKKLGLLSIVEN